MGAHSSDVERADFKLLLEQRNLVRSLTEVLKVFVVSHKEGSFAVNERSKKAENAPPKLFYRFDKQGTGVHVKSFPYPCCCQAWKRGSFFQNEPSLESGRTRTGWSNNGT